MRVPGAPEPMALEPAAPGSHKQAIQTSPSTSPVHAIATIGLLIFTTKPLVMQ